MSHEAIGKLRNIGKSESTSISTFIFFSRKIFITKVKINSDWEIETSTKSKTRKVEPLLKNFDFGIFN